MTTQSDVAVLIGRCNPFHKGHAQLLRHAAETSKLTVLLLGSAGLARSLRNPFTFQERKLMVEAWLQQEGITNVIVAGQRDYPYNNTLWNRSVQQNVGQVLDEVSEYHGIPKKPKINIIGSDRDETTWYLHAFPRWKPRLLDAYGGTESNPIGMNATEIRELLFSAPTDATARLVSMLPNTTYAFLEQFLGSPECARLQRWHEQNRRYKEAWSVAPYEPMFITCDSVIVQSGHILVVERGAEPGQGLWALPGGFLNRRERIKNGCIREAMEETGILLAEGKRAKEITFDILKGNIRKMRVFDDPNRSERGRTVTHAAYIRLDDTKPLPIVKGQFAPLEETGGKLEVETAKAFWLPIDEALRQMDMWFEDHHAIIETMVGGEDL